MVEECTIQEDDNMETAPNSTQHGKGKLARSHGLVVFRATKACEVVAPQLEILALDTKDEKGVKAKAAHGGRVNRPHLKVVVARDGDVEAIGEEEEMDEFKERQERELTRLERRALVAIYHHRRLQLILAAKIAVQRRPVHAQMLAARTE